MKKKDNTLMDILKHHFNIIREEKIKLLKIQPQLCQMKMNKNNKI